MMATPLLMAVEGLASVLHLGATVQSLNKLSPL